MIIYAAIGRAKDGAVLVDCCDPWLKGNANVITASFLEHLRDNPNTLSDGDRRSFVQRNVEDFDFFSSFINSACAVALGDDDVEEYFFHIFLKDGVYYTCISDDKDAVDQRA